jgi:hypothetical protein
MWRLQFMMNANGLSGLLASRPMICRLKSVSSLLFPGRYNGVPSAPRNFWNLTEVKRGIGSYHPHFRWKALQSFDSNRKRVSSVVVPSWRATSIEDRQ